MCWVGDEEEGEEDQEDQIRLVSVRPSHHCSAKRSGV